MHRLGKGEYIGYLPSLGSEKDEDSCSARFLLFIQSEIPTHVVMLTFRMGTVLSVNLI